MNKQILEARLRELLERIVKSSSRMPNMDGTIQPRDYAYQLVPTELIEEAEQALAASEPPTQGVGVYCAHCETTIARCPECDKQEWRLEAEPPKTGECNCGDLTRRRGVWRKNCPKSAEHKVTRDALATCPKR